jgi:hypothetical protein
MLNNDTILNVFAQYLSKDSIVEVVSTNNKSVTGKYLKGIID